MSSSKGKKLGDTLIALGVLTDQQLKSALAEQKRTSQVLGKVLVDNNFVTEEQLARAMAVQQDLPFIDLAKFDVKPDTAKKLSELQVRRCRALVLEDRNETYLVGFVDPADLRTQDELALVLKRPIDVAVITQAQLNRSIDRFFRNAEQIHEYAREVEIDLNNETGIVDISQLSSTIEDADAPVVKLMQTIFEEAGKTRASDIHIEPQEKRLVIRFRIDGELHLQLEADAKINAPLMVRLKLLSGLDISERRLPQDGRMSVHTGSNRFDVRLSIVPTPFGESAVMRLLQHNAEVRDLSGLGMPPRVLKQFSEVIASPHGIVLVTGPTGSGKTTTLFGALQKLNQPGVKILTCEDPIEYQIQGVTQVQVNDRIDLSFSRVLRSFLRQDPDILLIGEIRDNETAEIASRAAMTGHLVLSTLHTNDAISAPARLSDMGVPEYMVASTLLGIISQRLVRSICTYCSAPHQPTETEREWIAHFLKSQDHDDRYRRGKGCGRCNGTGYIGRVALFEMLSITPDLANLIHHGDFIEFARKGSQALGTDTIDQQAVAHVLSGVTTISEAMLIASAHRA